MGLERGGALFSSPRLRQRACQDPLTRQGGDALSTSTVKLMFNIGVFNTCQMPFWQSKKCFFGSWDALHKNMCSTKFPPFLHTPPFTMKASSKIPCHKIQWLKFTIINIDGLQSWHSSIHFQIPIIWQTLSTICERVELSKE